MSLQVSYLNIDIDKLNKVLEEDNEEEIPNDNTVIQSIAQDIKLEEITEKYEKAVQQINILEECYNAEQMATQVLQAFLIDEYHQKKEDKKRNHEAQEELEVERKYVQNMQTIACRNYDDLTKCMKNEQMNATLEVNLSAALQRCHTKDLEYNDLYAKTMKEYVDLKTKYDTLQLKYEGKIEMLFGQMRHRAKDKRKEEE